ncbi:hypothetical protein [Acetobacter thailandicus]|uniref:hypothetical protein n=1 Tax=Acetobacter thailandicus TaxID=1502842 RepID=UPI001BA4F30A|nr:hypothetical protein [Acetobacter thailandicus]MBS0986619.1 hypothetical protein [Acetobacter thailandicus]
MANIDPAINKKKEGTYIPFLLWVYPDPQYAAALRLVIMSDHKPHINDNNFCLFLMASVMPRMTD